MIVRQSDFDLILSRLIPTGVRSLDTETTGLRAYHQDRLFSLIIADSEKAYYFNFQPYPQLDDDWVLPRERLLDLKSAFENPMSFWFLSNAKFDMAMLAKEELVIAGEVHCTEAIGRVVRNDELKYGLDASAQRIGLEKSDEVLKYIAKHKLWDWEQIPGKKKRTKKMYFDKVPYAVMVPYGTKDAKLSFMVGEHQVEALKDISRGTALNHPDILKVLENERKFTKTCFKIEQTGILIDKEYCERAIDYEKTQCEKAEKDFFRETGVEFQDSRAVLKTVFEALGEYIPATEKGNSCFDDGALQTFKSPVARIIQRYRESHKKLTTYYQNFLYYADEKGRIHPNLKQGGTGTGRISCTDPNLQNLPDEEEQGLTYKVRRSFIPSPGKFFLMIDYDQMEYRMMLDYSQQMDLIEQVKAGVDVHEATAGIINEILGTKVTRSQAKTLNFGLLYGMGADALASALKTNKDSAIRLKENYFRALPFVQGFIRRVTRKAESQGYIFNWAGRRSYFKDINFCYKAPNYLIQGGCGDVVKFAMNKIDAFLEGKRSKMLMQIHDEILFEMDPSEIDLIPKIKEIMETVYPFRHLPLTCSIEYSFISWADKQKGIPDIGLVKSETEQVM